MCFIVFSDSTFNSPHTSSLFHQNGAEDLLIDGESDGLEGTDEGYYSSDSLFFSEGVQDNTVRSRVNRSMKT